ncbi:MAG: anti-sigma factor [Verrucomicrobia bacterium]|nr:anti-sigma factor [Verrucomicrobiota bacterium]
MNCEEAGRLLDAYLDRELAGDQRLEIERHLSHCDACRSRAHETEAFRSFFRASAPRYRAPDRLRTRILTAVRSQRATPGAGRAFRRTIWLYAAAMLVVSLCLYLCLSLTVFLPDRDKPLCHAAVLDHSRSLAADHLVDVASGDRQVVKSWLGARLPFYPPVVDFPIAGYSLIGGRVVVIERRPVAVVVYRRDEEVASLFCWPVSGGTVMDRGRQIDGYRVDTWSNVECNYILISRLTEREHDALLDLLRDRLPSEIY